MSISVEIQPRAQDLGATQIADTRHQRAQLARRILRWLIQQGISGDSTADAIAAALDETAHRVTTAARCNPTLLITTAVAGRACLIRLHPHFGGIPIAAHGDTMSPEDRRRLEQTRARQLSRRLARA